MSNTNDKRAPATATTEKAVRMYPRNSLKAQVRDPKEALSAFTVIQKHFSARA